MHHIPEIASSDALSFIMMSFVYNLIMIGRISPEKVYSVGLMTFLADNISDNMECLCSSLTELIEKFHRHFNLIKDDAVNEWKKSFLEDIFKEVSFPSMDIFEDYIDGFRSVFEVDSIASPNGLASPYLVCSTSFLGYYVRLFLAKWDALPFEDTCAFFDNVTSIVNNFTSNPKQINSYRHENVRVVLETLVSNGDVSPAETAIHRIFDFGIIGATGAGNLSHVSRLRDSGNDDDIRLAQANISLYQQAQLGAGKQQHAILSMAAMWTRNGMFSLAQSAVNEAIKIAHQRGDHTTIARALILMHYISRNCGNSGIDDGDILYRCLERCGSDPQLRVLGSQVIILLARRISQRSFSYNNETMKKSCDQFSAQQVWMMLSLFLYADVGVLMHAATGTFNSYVSSSSIQSTKQMPGANSASGNAAVSERIFLSMEDTGERSGLTLSSAFAAAELWLRLGSAETARLHCRRALRQCRVLFPKIVPDHAGREDQGRLASDIGLTAPGHIELLCAITSMHARLKVDSQYPLSISVFNRKGTADTEDSAQRSAVNRTCDHALRPLRLLHSLLSESISQPALVDLQGAQLYVRARQAMLLGQSGKALRLCGRLRQIYEDGSFALPGRELIQARLLYAVAVSSFDIDEAIASLSALAQEELAGGSSGGGGFSLEADVLRASLMMKLAIAPALSYSGDGATIGETIASDDRRQFDVRVIYGGSNGNGTWLESPLCREAAVVLSRAVAIAREANYPSVEALAARCFL